MRLGFILREAAKGLRQNVVMVVSVVLVTFVSLTFVGASVLLQLQINQMKGYWYDRMEVAVYLCDDTSTSPNCAGSAVSEESPARQQGAMLQVVAARTVYNLIEIVHFTLNFEH